MLSLIIWCFTATACVDYLPYNAALLGNDSGDGDALPKSWNLIPVSAQTGLLWYMPKPSPKETMPLLHPQYDYVVGPGDLITLTLYVIDPEGSDPLKRVIPAGASLQSENEFLVSADGYLSIPLAGKIHVAGKPFHHVRNNVLEALRNYFVNPQMEMRVVDFANGQLTISGEVGKPGILELSHDDITVVEAIEKSGGVTQTADLTLAQIKRINGDIVPIDLHALLYEGDTTLNYQLQAGDTLHIPRNHANKAFILGEVVDPKSIQLHPSGASLTEVLSDSSGLQPATGDPAHIYVLRGYVPATSDDEDSEQQKVNIFHLDATHIANLVYADQLRILPRDVIYVTEQPVTSWNRFINQLLPVSVSSLIDRTNYAR